MGTEGLPMDKKDGVTIRALFQESLQEVIVVISLHAFSGDLLVIFQQSTNGIAQGSI